MGGRNTAAQKERNATILAHNYQLPPIQDIADHVGDSLGLARIAATAPEDTIVFCGVHFMAETAKILSPDKTVLIPDARAGCSLADSITAEDLQAWRDDHPGAAVVSYVNTTAAVKALTDYCCTSSNAVDVVNAIEPDREVLFLPDQFLGQHVQRVTGRKNMHIWRVSATCTRRSTVTNSRRRRGRTPTPSCSCTRSAGVRRRRCTWSARAISPRSGSRSCPPGMLEEARRTQARKVLVATEIGMIYQLQKAAPQVDFEAVNPRRPAST